MHWSRHDTDTCLIMITCRDCPVLQPSPPRLYPVIAIFISFTEIMMCSCAILGISILRKKSHQVYLLHLHHKFSV